MDVNAKKLKHIRFSAVLAARNLPHPVQLSTMGPQGAKRLPGARGVDRRFRIKKQAWIFRILDRGWFIRPFNDEKQNPRRPDGRKDEH
jgi:hypothetical protein